MRKPSRRSQVVVYAAQDQVYAEPILREFEKETGIKVKAVYDSEAVKTVGLANRLLAERSHPQCDVFWGNEEMRTRQLAAQSVFRETNGWAAFGYRSRRIVINTNFVTSVAPVSSRRRKLRVGVKHMRTGRKPSLRQSSQAHCSNSRMKSGAARSRSAFRNSARRPRTFTR